MGKIILPIKVEYILKTLNENHFAAYVVGGSVRDALMGIVPNDFDITTNALPKEVAEVFRDYQVIGTGLKHGTVTLLVENEPFEITTFRVDGEYLDSRRPEKVYYTRSLKEDLGRRDFTINGIAFNPKTGLKDYYNGRADIEKKQIMCVGNPDKRFSEDALRIMRGLRFSSQLSFKIEKKTEVSIFENKNLLKNISAERINAEFSKLLLGDNVQSVLMRYREIIKVFIPEIEEMIDFNQNNSHHFFDVWEHTVKAVSFSKKILEVRLSLFFHDMGKPKSYSEDDKGIGHFYGHSEISEQMAGKVLRRLKYDNETIKNVKKLVLNHDILIKPTEKNIKRHLNKVGGDNFFKLLDVKSGDTFGQKEDHFDPRFMELEKTRKIAEEIIEKQICFSKRQLVIDGYDIIKAGVPEGKIIGEILDKLTLMVIEEDVKNEKTELINKATEIANK